MPVELLLRPDLGKKAMRLKCRFVIDAAPAQPYYRAIWERELEKAKYKAMDWFVKDMAKEGWTYLEKHDVRMRGPFAATVTVTPVKSQWHIPSRDLISAVQSGYRFDASAQDGGCAYSVPLLGETDSWEFELAAVFVRNTILIEYDEKEESPK